MRRVVTLAGTLIFVLLLYPYIVQANSLYFDGINDHVDFGDVLDLGNSFTLEAWVLLEPGATGGFPTWDVDVIAKVGGVGGGNGYELYYGIDEEPDRICGQFNQSGGSWPQYQVLSPTASIHGAWTHIAITYDNDTMRLYKDGVLVASNAIGPHTVVNTASPLMISGNANNMNYWQGWIDEVRIWGVARSLEQIQGAMYGPLTGKETGLLGYWNFDEGYGGGVALDVTSGGHNGTLKNGVTWSTLNAPGNAPTICDIQMSHPDYITGDVVIAKMARLANPGEEDVSVEIKAWVDMPDGSVISYVNTGADGSYLLEKGFDHDYGPATLAVVTPETPRGTYTVGCRLLDPMRGKVLAESISTFEIK